MKEWKVMLIVIAVVLGLAALAVANTAGPMTWSSPVPDASTSGGYNQIRTMEKNNINELRARVKAMGIFAGYTSQGNNGTY